MTPASHLWGKLNDKPSRSKAQEANPLTEVSARHVPVPCPLSSMGLFSPSTGVTRNFDDFPTSTRSVATMSRGRNRFNPLFIK